MVIEATGNPTVKAKHDAMVATLANVQAAWGAIGLQGYLFPYSIVAWDNLCVVPRYLTTRAHAFHCRSLHSNDVLNPLPHAGLRTTRGIVTLSVSLLLRMCARLAYADRYTDQRKEHIYPIMCSRCTILCPT